MQTTTGKWVYLWLDHCDLRLYLWKVNLAAKHKQTFDDLKVLSLTNFHALMITQNFVNKSENCSNKGDDNWLQSDIKETLGRRPGWMIYWSGIWYRNWGQSSTIGTTCSGYYNTYKCKKHSTALFFNISGQVSGYYFHKTVWPIRQVKKKKIIGVWVSQCNMIYPENQSYSQWNSWFW